jgi:hypothetical protein
MTNPTTQAGLQFTAPYNILPDLMLKNPTAPYQSQFYRPFNILPDPLFPNPTAAVPSQFQKPFNILPDPAKLPDPNIGNPLEPKPATTFPGPPPVENNGVFVTKLANAEV